MVKKGRMNTLRILITKDSKKKTLVHASARKRKVQKKDHVLQIYCGSPGEEEKSGSNAERSRKKETSNKVNE
jgi:hypothetical protein